MFTLKIFFKDHNANRYIIFKPSFAKQASKQTAQ